MPQPFVLFDNVCKYYQMGETRIAASDHVSFEIEKGEFCVILGPSGAGKTTVLNMLGGMDTCDEGTILLDGEKVSGFDKKRLFYTQGDYGLFQCSEPCCQETFDNEALIRQMVEAQGYVLAPDGQLTVPENTILKTSVPSELVPHCPHCGKLLTMNLRSDDSFVEDAGWHAAAERYSEFLRRHEGQKILFLELGVGYNTPVIIKYPFWRMTARNPNATYVCINKGEAVCPNEIAKQSLLFDGDIAAVLAQIK